MARTEKSDKLRGCPTCGCKDHVEHLGMRDYSRWLSGLLPGRVSGSDIDCVIEQSRTNRVLFMEFKPLGVYLPTGQRLLLRAMARRDIDVWVVWEDNDGEHVEVGAMDKTGEVPFVERMTIAKFERRVTSWWRQGYEAA